MATCPACQKPTSGDKPTCYFCGAFLVARLECPGCKRAIPATRTTCHYCGTALGGAKAAAAKPAVDPVAKTPVDAHAKTPALTPPALVTPDIQLEQPSALAAWLERYEMPIDLTLFVLAAPIALCAIATQAVIHMFASMRGGGG